MREVDGHTRVCGLIGNPVEHTLSPVLQNTLAELTGKNFCYLPLKVETGFLEEAVKGAYAMNFLGTNVTVPYKSDVIPYLKDIDPLAETIGAVNTLVRVEGGFKGYNTDMPGLLRAMVSDGVQIEGERIVILGAGGVARAVAVLLAKKGAEEIILMNRTVEKALAIAEEVNDLTGKTVAVGSALENYKEVFGDRKYLVIQATSVGMHPDVEHAVIEDEAFYQHIHTGYDLIFNPAETKFMKLVRQAGGNAYNGAKMLLYQGVIAYELWTGIPISEEQAETAFAAMKKA